MYAYAVDTVIAWRQEVPALALHEEKMTDCSHGVECSRMLCPGTWSSNWNNALLARLSVLDYEGAAFGVELC